MGQAFFVQRGGGGDDSEDAGPGGIGEVARPLTDHQGRACSVANITDRDPAVRVEDAGSRIGH